MKEKKFKPGKPFSNVHELIIWLNDGNWVFWHGKPKHPSVIANQQLQILIKLTSGPSTLYRAIENKGQ